MPSAAATDSLAGSILIVVDTAGCSPASWQSVVKVPRPTARSLRESRLRVERTVLRDVLIRVTQGGLVQARWTNAILDETFRSIQERLPDLDPVKLAHTRELMSSAIRDVLVTGYEPLIPAVTSPDPDDRHVVAAAIRARAQVIVTANVRDFPAESLSQWDVQARTPDEFLLDQFHLDGPSVYGAIQRVADSWRNPPGTVSDVLERLERSGLVETVALLRGWQMSGLQQD